MKNLAFALVLLTSSFTINAEQTLSFGIVPQQSASKLARLWSPIFDHINRKTGLTIRFATAPDIPTFEKRLAAGEYDLAYMNPYHYVVFSKAPGYQVLSKARDKRIKGIIVVRKDSKIDNLKGLDNSTLAFPAPASFAASILTRSALSLGNVSFTPKYVSSHDSVYRTVAKGIYPAGGGVVRTFKNMAPDVRDQLKILWTTKGYTPHAIAVHPRIKQDDAQKIQQVLVGMEQQAAGKKLLESIKIKGFEIASDRDWDDVRGLNIKLLSNL
jgi:phosphonate transport system substrate-binding protein